MLDQVQKTVSLLRDTYRHVIELRVYEGFSTRPAADRLDASRSYVATRLIRATKLL